MTSGPTRTKHSVSPFHDMLIRALKGRAQLRSLIGEYHDAQQDYLTIKRYSRNIHDRIEYLAGMAGIYDKTGDFKEALKLCRRSIRLAHSSNDTFNVLRLMSAEVVALYRMGRLNKALARAQRTVRLFNTLRGKTATDKEILAEKAGLFNTIGSIYFMTEDYDKALHYFERSKTIGGDIKQLNKMAGFSNNLSLVHWKMRRYDDAIRCCLESLKVNEQIGHVKGIGINLNNLGLIYDEMGNFEEGLEYFKRSLAHFSRIGDQLGTGIALYNIASYHKEISGDYAQAEDYFIRCLRIHKHVGDIYSIAETHLALAEIYMIQHKTQKFLQSVKELKKSIPEIQSQGHYTLYLSLLIKYTAIKGTRQGISEIMDELYTIHTSKPPGHEADNVLGILIKGAAQHKLKRWHTPLTALADKLTHTVRANKNPLDRVKLYHALVLWYYWNKNSSQARKCLDELRTAATKYKIRSFDKAIEKFSKRLSW
jgi:tetratricopeptide (TPR) repeat protein